MHPQFERRTLGKMENPVRGFLNGAAALAAVVGGVFLWLRSPDEPSRQLVLLVFVLGMVTLYTVSGLYHSIPWRKKWHDRMQRLDHSMIYIQVAGTYTPIAFIVLEDTQRLTVLGVVWGIALVGILEKTLLRKLRHWPSITMQIIQGAFGLVLLAPLAQRLPLAAVTLLVAGLLLYGVGTVFYVTKRPHLWPRTFSYHEVFHIFVVAGSAAHYAMIFSYVAPFQIV